MKWILVNRNLTACSGCRACEVACVAHHEERFGTAAARIRVVKIELLGIDQPHVCRQCGTAATQAPCIAACPVGALRKAVGRAAGASCVTGLGPNRAGCL